MQTGWGLARALMWKVFWRPCVQFPYMISWWYFKFHNRQRWMWTPVPHFAEAYSTLWWFFLRIHVVFVCVDMRRQYALHTNDRIAYNEKLGKSDRSGQNENLRQSSVLRKLDIASLVVFVFCSHFVRRGWVALAQRIRSDSTLRHARQIFGCIHRLGISSNNFAAVLFGEF